MNWRRKWLQRRWHTSTPYIRQACESIKNDKKKICCACQCFFSKWLRWMHVVAEYTNHGIRSSNSITHTRWIWMERKKAKHKNQTERYAIFLLWCLSFLSQPSLPSLSSSFHIVFILWIVFFFLPLLTCFHRVSSLFSSIRLQIFLYVLMRVCVLLVCLLPNREMR